ncbi:Lamin-like protein [Quillaja saponaria]|uniref:Lamin-like protein n=1 Tax=Quillaja saponaria TaxID=32244 RepID=A0AAD7Q3S5_QUISA|nr:Lamin-like protein [Quillaja saponaria]
MENLRVSMIMIMMGWLVLLTSTLVMGGPTLHKVGGIQGWNQNVNYTEWSAQQHIIIGDWLIFVFDKRYFNVLEVNSTNYENCNDRDFIKNITRGGRDVVQLTEARLYYYLSSGGYCYHGMKVAVQVEDPGAAPALAPAAPAKNASPWLRMYAGNHMILANIVLSLAFLLFMMH